MKVVKKSVRMLAFIIIFCLLTGCGSKDAVEPESTIKFWHINAAPAMIEAVTAESTVPLDIRGFDNEDELAAAFNTIRPDIILCSMQQAEHLYDNGHLKAFSKDFFNGITPDCDIVNSGCFLPIGGAVELVTVDRNFTDLVYSDFEALCESADMPSFLSVSDYSGAFAALLAEKGESYSGVRNTDIRNEAFTRIYNSFAELSLRGCLSKENAVCRIAPSSELAGFSFENTDIYSLAASGHSVLTEYYGFVCTGDITLCERFLSAYLARSSADTAISCGLIPVTDDRAESGDALAHILLNIKEECSLLPITDNCEWLDKRDEFNSFIQASFFGG